MHNPSPGLSFVPEYQIAGLPWVTSSVGSATAVKYAFPFVTRSLTLINQSTTATDGIAIGFTQNGVAGTNRVVVMGGKDITLEMRCKECWIIATAGTPAYSLAAGLTQIAARCMPSLTGSLTGAIGGTGWEGVG